MTKLVINNLNFDLGYVKYVDNTTAFSVSNNRSDCSLQKASDYHSVLIGGTLKES